MKQLSLAVLAVALLLAACKSAPDSTHATPNATAPRGDASLPAALASATAPAEASPVRDPELVAFPSNAGILHGFVFRPQGRGPFPAVVFNHGSERLPGDKRGQAELYVRHGFVLFVPHRRGHGRSRDVGQHIEDVWARSGHDARVFVDELVAQSDDVMAAVAYVGALPFVDRKHVAVAGCSLGGIESLLAAERGTGIVAAVDFAGASMTWKDNVPLQDRMKVAARAAKVPVFFLQAENDFDITPSETLSDEMRAAGRPARVHIYPPNGTTPEEGHGFCAGGERPPWGPEVLEFLRQAMPAH